MNRGSHTVTLHKGMSRIAALRAARKLGCKVEDGHRHGELRFSHPLMLKRMGGLEVLDTMVVHASSKEACSALADWLLELEAKIGWLRGWVAEK